ncbi:MAG: outer membrane protein assembly factor BamA [Gemmatimonadota bacterium]|nr:MAG: outer membrane protein assembly factor BamA [Gemmatimonadota bacterium]
MKRKLGIPLFTALVAFGARAEPLLGQAQAGVQPVLVDSVQVIGNTRQATPTVLTELGIRPGDQVTYTDVQRGVQRLWSTGEYGDIRVYAVDNLQGATTLVVDLVERPFIVGYEFQGLEHVGSGGIRDTAGLQSSVPLDPSAVHEASRRIRAELSNLGYLMATVDTSLAPAMRPDEFRLIFRVDEGRRLVVNAIEFEGNEALSDAELVSAMSVKPEGFLWWKTGEFRQDDFQEDLEVNLVEHYGRNGFLDLEVLGDTMIVDPRTGKTKLVVRVDEGRQYRIAEFRVEGNKYFPTELLEARFDPRSRSLLQRLPLIGSSDEGGDPVFDTHEWRDATDEIQQLYRNAGFLYARIDPLVEKLPTAEDGQPRVRLIWRIEEESQAYIQLVEIAGNTTTHERVVRDRLVLLPGDVYGDERIVSSYQSIQGLGFFDQVPPDEALDVRPNEEGDINVTFRVKERHTGNINFGASLSPSIGLAGFIGYEQPNLFGRAKSGRFRWMFGNRTNDIEVGYTDPAILGSRNSLGIALRSSRDQFSFIGLGRRRQTGGSLSFGTPFFGSRWTRVSLRYSLFRDEYDANADELDLEQRELLGVGTRSSIELRLSRDTRNHPVFPTSGSRNSAALEVTGGALGGDGDYQKITFESTWHTPIARLVSDPMRTPIDLAVGLGIQGGFILGDNPFYLERFFAGGVRYGPKLRGYEELTITPSGHVPQRAVGFSQLDRVGEAYFLLNANIGVRLGSSFFVNAFYDAGNVWSTPHGLNPTDLLRGFGIGVSLVTPMGPLGIDYAYGIDRLDEFGQPDPGWRLHFRFGQVF